MDLPSMVQRSGDTLIVRSVVSGNQLYMDQTSSGTDINAANAGATVNAATPKASGANHLTPTPIQLMAQRSLSASVMEQQLERYQQQILHHQQQQQQQQPINTGGNGGQQGPALAVANVDAKEEGLPQCKIKRNYSCSHCTYFTQNPRYHLTHLRDVHGEKIVINKCKLCLYASRHFQKLVRHMKMVHGCTDGIPGGHGQARGKRGMSREARKRRLEESVGVMGGNINNIVPDMPTLEQVKRELQLQEQKLQRDIEAFNRQQEEQKQIANSASLFAFAYERQLQAHREREREQIEARNNISYEPEKSPTTSHNVGATNIIINHNNNNITTSFHPTVELATPSPSGSATPPSTSHTPNPPSVAMAAHGGSYDEQPQNRLLKCSLCDFTTLYRAQLVDHELEDHCKTKFFRCEKCSYVTHIKARFSKHVKYHSMPMIKCVTCDFRTPYKWNLDRHMKNHGGAGPFKCAACDFTADIKQSLTVHEMNHHVPPVGNAAGISLARRRNKVGGTDINDDFLSDSAELEDQFNNNMDEEYDESEACPSKRSKYDDEPTDLSQKGGGGGTSSETSSNVGGTTTPTPKSRRPVPNLIPIAKAPKEVLDLTKDTRSSLTEIASMFFSEQQISEILEKNQDQPQLSPTTTIATVSSHNSRHMSGKKSNSSNFFDQLQNTALVTAAQNNNLICQCGYIAKCLSESIIHGKSCDFSTINDDMDEMEIHDDTEGRLEIDEDDDDKQSHSALNLSVTGSTRCQHCRHRCKSSVDLLNHLKQCVEAIRCANEMYDSTNSGESNSTERGGNVDHQVSVQQQRVCIWNAKQIAAATQNMEKILPKVNNAAAPGAGTTNSASTDENSYYGVETAPGYGEVTKKMTPEEEAANSSLKKVYKCPHCSFWASTASRFHVHIVGHLNKKPFECSLCSYRSNWRWDITKHIRLKTIRDPSHKTAKVLMNDETGRRNYTKYNKYITLMKVTEEDGDPKLMKSGEMTPNQVASLAFLKDYNKLGNVQREHDITLEPVSSSKAVSSSMGGLDENQLADNFIRLPLLATVMNAAMAQQQHQHQQQLKAEEHNNTAMITPSVTISPVKRSPPPPLKPTDDLITEVHQDGNEKKTFYRCRKCSFRHQNRDAVLAHVKIHYQDPNFPIVTATLNSSPKSSTTTPLQVSINSNPQLYMNKVFAAMCLSQQQQQQQQQQGSPSAGNASTSNSQHSIISAGLLQQAIQQAQNSPTPNATALSGLALALAGKCPTGSSPTSAKVNAASILEHGEQNASQNEASADSLTSPTPTTTTKTSHATMSLQDLLTSPRSGLTYGAGCGTSSSSRSNQSNNNNNNLVMGPLGNAAGMYDAKNGNNNVSTNSTDAMVSNNTTYSSSKTRLSSSNTCNTTSPITTVTTTFQTTPNSSDNNNLIHLIGSNTSSTSYGIGRHQHPHHHNNHHNSEQQTRQKPSSADADGGLMQIIDNNGDSFYTNNNNGVTHGTHGYSTNSSSSSSINKPPTKTTSFSSSSSNTNNKNTSTTKTNSSSSANKLVADKTSNNNMSPSSSSSSARSMSSSSASSLSSLSSSVSPKSSSSPINAAAYTQNQQQHNNSNGGGGQTSGVNANGTNGQQQQQQQPQQQHSHSQISSTNLLTVNDGDRREPSPYRCGHCHQLSNWKHVIQRHCRLKHSGDIRIETLERNNSNLNAATAIYRPLIGNVASNESSTSNSYGLTQKALQQQQQQQAAVAIMNLGQNTTNNNNSPVMQNKNNEFLLQHSPLSASAVAAAAVNAASTSQDLQTAAVYFAAAYKAATSSANGLNAEELLQLQNNDQIEITRLPSNNNNNNNSSNSNVTCTNLAQLLEQANAVVQNAQNKNTKSKKQQCHMCPYVSDSKSQMNYHISLHKPTQYECHLCTFVCAKKQHLSSHMRTVHQQPLASGCGAGGAPSVNNGINLDFTVALQFAAAAQAQQDSLKSPLAIDLTALQQTLQATNQRMSSATKTESSNTDELPPEYQYKLISYCNKCPARFAQKHNDEHDIKIELAAHLRAHDAATDEAYICEYCEYHTEEEQLLQLHRAVHMTHYQEKYNELYKNCKEDPKHPAPKLMQITCTKTQMPDAIWLVDNELSTQLKQQQQRMMKLTNGGGGAGSTTANFEGNNSLLKKQLESGGLSHQLMANASSTSMAVDGEQSPPFTPTPMDYDNNDNNDGGHDDDDDNNDAENPGDGQQYDDGDDGQTNSMPSTSASVATSDLAADGSSDAASCDDDESSQPERCLYCPYETSDRLLLKAHMQKHKIVSNVAEAYSCEHCDYTDADEAHIEEHTMEHFNAEKRLKSVEFFTSYDNLEISVEQEMDEDEDDDDDEDNDQDKNQRQSEIPEHNNNNLDNVINENTKHETEQQQQFNQSKGTTLSTKRTASSSSAGAGGIKKKKATTKIIVFKSDSGDHCVKQSDASSFNLPCSDNISDRLRRRILRGGAGNTGGEGNNSSNSNNAEQHESAATSGGEHKMVIVNPKTGKVLSRK